MDFRLFFIVYHADSGFVSEKCNVETSESEFYSKIQENPEIQDSSVGLFLNLSGRCSTSAQPVIRFDQKAFFTPAGKTGSRDLERNKP